MGFARLSRFSGWLAVPAGRPDHKAAMDTVRKRPLHDKQLFKTEAEAQEWLVGPAFR